ncbi:MAG: HAD-IA family hydrolase [Pirellulales bacterium]
MREPVKAVVFDAVGTLLYADPPVAAVYAEAGRQFGSRLDEPDVDARFRAAFARQEAIDAAQHAGRTGEPRERDRWRSIVADVFDDVTDGEALFATLWQHFARPEHWRLYDDVGPAWRRLSQQGFVLGIASNFDRRLEVICRGKPALADCRWLFISSQLGCRKPSPAFFQAIQDRLALPAAQVLVVGDDLENDYRGALAAGCPAVLLDRHQRYRLPGRVGSLAEICRITRAGT